MLLIFISILVAILLYGVGITAKVMGSNISWFWVLFGPILLIMLAVLIAVTPLVIVIGGLTLIS